MSETIKTQLKKVKNIQTGKMNIQLKNFHFLHLGLFVFPNLTNFSNYFVKVPEAMPAMSKNKKMLKRGMMSIWDRERYLLI